ncbi:hypothetical protein [Thermosporothrix hazakensis]|nr:hypothetical protein [Thermosporothrix hazakensis]
MAHSGCGLAQAISWSRAVFLLVQRIGTVDVLFGSFPSFSQP